MSICLEEPTEPEGIPNWGGLAFVYYSTFRNYCTAGQRSWFHGFEFLSLKPYISQP